MTPSRLAFDHFSMKEINLALVTVSFTLEPRAPDTMQLRYYFFNTGINFSLHCSFFLTVQLTKALTSFDETSLLPRHRRPPQGQARGDRLVES